MSFRKPTKYKHEIFYLLQEAAVLEMDDIIQIIYEYFSFTKVFTSEAFTKWRTLLLEEEKDSIKSLFHEFPENFPPSYFPFCLGLDQIREFLYELEFLFETDVEPYLVNHGDYFWNDRLPCDMNIRHLNLLQRRLLFCAVILELSNPSSTYPLSISSWLRMDRHPAFLAKFLEIHPHSPTALTLVVLSADLSRGHPVLMALSELWSFLYGERGYEFICYLRAVSTLIPSTFTRIEFFMLCGEKRSSLGTRQLYSQSQKFVYLSEQVKAVIRKLMPNFSSPFPFVMLA